MAYGEYDRIADLAAASAKLAGRPRRKLANNTYLERRAEDCIALKLHNTDIMRFDATGYSLFAEGWQTVTTKDRLNRFAAGIRIIANRGVWRVYPGPSHTWPDRETPYHAFADGMHVATDGTITGAGSDDKAPLQVRARVKKFAAAFVDALIAGNVEPPGAGDCFYCQMRKANAGENAPTLGEMAGSDHIVSHIGEAYFVPSLLHRALETAGASQSMWWFVGACGWDTSADKELAKRMLERDKGFEAGRIRKALVKYITQQIGAMPADAVLGEIHRLTAERLEAEAEASAAG